MVIVDTSVWIEVFKKRNPLDLEALIDFEQVVTCLPIVQEVLQGFQDENAFRAAREAMLNLPMVENPLRLDLFEEAISLYRIARQKGVMVRSSIDCIIAACALRANIEILHRDRDYANLSRVSRLRQRAI